METRDVPAALSDNGVALVSYNGTVDSAVSISNAATGVPEVPTITPFAGYRGPIVAAAGDVNHDGVSDVIVGAQVPNGHVKVFDGTTGALLQSFLAFPGYNGAVSVGAADVDGDGYADVLVSASATNAHVKAFSGQDGAPLASFLAFPGFLGQVSVSGADFDGDGADEIIVGAGGMGANGRVALFSESGSAFNTGFFAFPGFNGAISVAGGDVNGDGISDIVVGAGPGAPGGAVKAFSGAGFTPVASFIPFSARVTQGVTVRVADGNMDGRRDIFVALQGGGITGLTGFDGATGYALARSGGGLGTYSGYDTGSVSDPSFGDNGFTPIIVPDPGYDPGYWYDPGSDYYDPGYYDPGYYDPGNDYDPGYYDPGYYDPGYYDPGDNYDPGYYDPDYYD